MKFFDDFITESLTPFVHGETYTLDYFAKSIKRCGKNESKKFYLNIIDGYKLYFYKKNTKSRYSNVKFIKYEDIKKLSILINNHFDNDKQKCENIYGFFNTNSESKPCDIIINEKSFTFKIHLKGCYYPPIIIKQDIIDNEMDE